MVENALLNNRLLAALPQSCVQQIADAGTFVDVPLGCILFERGTRPHWVYFLTSGVASVVFSSIAGTTIEQATEGSEGVVGWANLLGPGLAESSCTAQIGGEGLRIPTETMQALFDGEAVVRKAVLEFTQHQVFVAKQILACNRLHRAEARFSRWLLMLSDRVGSQMLPTTQEFMSAMLGTRRTTVAEVASRLAKLGALEGRRGGVRILDRRLLERHACECYRLLKPRFDRLYTKSTI